MKKFISSIAVLGLLVMCAVGQSVPSLSPSLNTNVTYTGNSQTNIILLTNSAKIASVQIISLTNNVTVRLYDNNATNQTITNAAYTNFLTYVTNWVTTSVSTMTGMTNIQTNSMLFETNVLQGSLTNNLPYWQFNAPAGPVMVTTPVNLLVSKGLMIVLSTNATIGIQYRIND